MRWVLAGGLMVCAGCGGTTDKLAGAWRVDPASIRVSILPAGAINNREWQQALPRFAEVKLFFNNGTATLTAFGRDSQAKYKLIGSNISIDRRAAWPALSLQGDMRMHATIDQPQGTVELDFLPTK